MALYTVALDTTTTPTWTAAFNGTVIIELTGHGGAGCQSAGPFAGAGGGGGGYSKTAYTVSSGTQYDIVFIQGDSGYVAVSPHLTGTVICRANNGTSGISQSLTPGTGGSTSGAVGDTKTAGSNGTSSGGAGAGPYAGAGGSVGATNTAGSNGVIYGGGGGGGGATTFPAPGAPPFAYGGVGAFGYASFSLPLGTMTGSCYIAFDLAGATGKKSGMIGTCNIAFVLSSAPGGVTITNTSCESPIVVTCASHGLHTGSYVTISGVTGNEAANGTFQVTVINSNSFSLNNSYANGCYVSGGTISDSSPSTSPPPPPGDLNTLILENSATVGVSPIVLTGAVATYSAFSDWYNSGDIVQYYIANGSGSEFEYGIGRYDLSSKTLSRSNIGQNSLGTDGPLNFSSGAKTVAGLGESTNFTSTVSGPTINPRDILVNPVNGTPRVASCRIGPAATFFGGKTDAQLQGRSGLLFLQPKYDPSVTGSLITLFRVPRGIDGRTGWEQVSVTYVDTDGSVGYSAIRTSQLIPPPFCGDGMTQLGVIPGNVTPGQTYDVFCYIAPNPPNVPLTQAFPGLFIVQWGDPNARMKNGVGFSISNYAPINSPTEYFLDYIPGTSMPRDVNGATLPVYKYLGTVSAIAPGVVASIPYFRLIWNEFNQVGYADAQFDNTDRWTMDPNVNVSSPANFTNFPSRVFPGTSPWIHNVVAGFRSSLAPFTVSSNCSCYGTSSMQLLLSYAGTLNFMKIIASGQDSSSSARNSVASVQGVPAGALTTEYREEYIDTSRIGLGNLPNALGCVSFVVYEVRQGISLRPRVWFGTNQDRSFTDRGVRYSPIGAGRSGFANMYVQGEW